MRCLLLVLLLIPVTAGSGNYQRVANGMRVVENKVGKITVTERTTRFKKLYYFVSSHLKEKNPLNTTELIYVCEYPEVMAAIASVESEFNPYAIGPCKEVSAWQILEWELGDPTNTNDGLNAALKVFKEKRLIAKNIPQAVERYNGRGPKARLYKVQVLKKMNQIHNIKIA